MKYIKPANETIENASYVNANPLTGVKGSTIDAAAIENPMREIVNVIVGAGLTPSETDLTQLKQAIDVLMAPKANSSDVNDMVANFANKDVSNLSVNGKKSIAKLGTIDATRGMSLVNQDNWQSVWVNPIVIPKTGYLRVRVYSNSWIHFMNGDMQTENQSSEGQQNTNFIPVMAGDSLVRSMSFGNWEISFFPCVGD